MFQVKKKSGKPFKSGKKVNSVKGIVTNENDPQKRNAYIFYDDDSVVNTDICEIITKNKENGK